MRKLLTVTAVVCAALLIAAPVGADEEEDQEIADGVAAATADGLPDGWEEDEPSEDTDDVEPPPECDDVTQAVDDAKEGAFAEISYTDPADPVGLTEAGTMVFVFPKAKAAKKFAKALTGDDAAACFGASGVLFGPGADVTVEEIEVNKAEGFVLTVAVEGDVFVIESLRARVGRGVVTVNAASLNEPLPFVADLMATLEERLEEAL